MRERAARDSRQDAQLPVIAARDGQPIGSGTIYGGRTGSPPDPRRQHRSRSPRADATPDPAGDRRVVSHRSGARTARASWAWLLTGGSTRHRRAARYQTQCGITVVQDPTTHAFRTAAQRAADGPGRPLPAVGQIRGCSCSCHAQRRAPRRRSTQDCRRARPCHRRQAVAYSCPDCHGVLWEIGRSGPAALPLPRGPATRPSLGLQQDRAGRRRAVGSRAQPGGAANLSRRMADSWRVRDSARTCR